MVDAKRCCVVIVWFMATVIFLSCSAFGAKPIARDDFVTIDEDTSVLVDVLANDTDPDGKLLTIASVSTPNHGTASIEWGKVRYTPDAHFYGTDSFSYTVTNGTEIDTAKVTVTIISVNDGPIAVADAVVTTQGTSVSFTLKATDVDLDPSAVGGYGLVFEIVDGPAHGELSGDLTAVTYTSPDTASVEVTYTPEPEFTGTDSITFSVTDQFGAFDMAKIPIGVSERETGMFAGTWDTSITLKGQPFEISAFTSTLAGVYELGEFKAQMIAGWKGDSFSSLRINTSFPLEDVLNVRTTLAFTPNVPAMFNHWRTTATFRFSDIGFTYTFYLPKNLNSSYNQLVAQGRIEDVSLTSTTRLAGQSLAFEKQEFRARWKWSECDLSLDAKLSIEGEKGFNEFLLTVRDIPILEADENNIFAITLRLDTTFTTTTKAIKPTLTLRSDWIECFKILCELVTGEDDTSIEGISLYGLLFKTWISDDMQIDIGISFVETKNSSVTGYSDYSVKWMLSGSTLSCCGSPGKWQIATYFQSGESALLGWGMTTFKLETALADQIEISTKLTFRTEAPHWEWTGGLEIDW